MHDSFRGMCNHLHGQYFNWPQTEFDWNALFIQIE